MGEHGDGDDTSPPTPSTALFLPVPPLGGQKDISPWASYRNRSRTQQPAFVTMIHLIDDDDNVDDDMPMSEEAPFVPISIQRVLSSLIRSLSDAGQQRQFNDIARLISGIRLIAAETQRESIEAMDDGVVSEHQLSATGMNMDLNMVLELIALSASGGWRVVNMNDLTPVTTLHGTVLSNSRGLPVVDVRQMYVSTSNIDNYEVAMNAFNDVTEKKFQKSRDLLRGKGEEVLWQPPPLPKGSFLLHRGTVRYSHPYGSHSSGKVAVMMEYYLSILSSFPKLREWIWRLAGVKQNTNSNDIEFESEYFMRARRRATSAQAGTVPSSIAEAWMGYSGGLLKWLYNTPFKVEEQAFRDILMFSQIDGDVVNIDSADDDGDVSSNVSNTDNKVKLAPKRYRVDVFRVVPQSDIFAFLPGAAAVNSVLSLADKVAIGFTTSISIISVVVAVLCDHLDYFNLATLLWLIAIMFVFIAISCIVRFWNSACEYDDWRREYGLNTHRGSGFVAVEHILKEVREQRIKELILVLFFLWRHGTATSEELKSVIRMHLLQTFNVKCGVCTESALQTLLGLGLVRVNVLRKKIDNKLVKLERWDVQGTLPDVLASLENTWRTNVLNLETS